jgi:RNA polymerase sigma-70 factor (ECF subfamily)
MDTDRSVRIVSIVARCQKGEHEAFHELVDLFASRCYGYFYRLSGNREISNDLLSELYIKLVEKIVSFKGESFEKWLFTIASNIFHDYLRSQYRQKRMLESKARELPEEDPKIKSGPEIGDKLQMYLGKLDDDTRQVILQRYYGDLSFKELAEMRKEPIGTTLSKTHRGLKKLRELMGDDRG